MTGKGRLQRFERKLERAIVGSFAKAFRAEVQPVEIASAVRRAMDDRATNMTRGRTFVPHRYTVELSETDYERLTAYAEDVEGELIAAAAEHADSQHYRTKAAFEMEFSKDPSLETGVFRIHLGGAEEHVGQRADRSHSAGAARGDSAPDGGESDGDRAQSGPAPPDSDGDDGNDTSGSSDSWATATRAPAPGGSPYDYQRDGTYEPEFPAAYGEEYAPPHPPPPPVRSHARPPQREPEGQGGRDDPAQPGGAGNREAQQAWHGGVPARHIPPADRPWVEIDGDRYPLLGPLTVLGRDTDAGIVLDDANVSRRHSEVRVTTDGPHLLVNLKDLGSTNGTWVNGERISSARLHDRDRITVGQTELIFHAGRR